MENPKGFVYITPLKNTDALNEYCTNKKVICLDGSLRMCFGQKTSNNKNDRILATYGIEKVDVKNKEPVAFCGFDLKNKEMIITHTPQGIKPNEFTNSHSRNKLVQSNFRQEMMDVMIQIARSLALEGIVGFPAAESFVFTDKKHTDKLKKRKNDLYDFFGFVLKKPDLQHDTQYYYLPLKLNPK